MKKIMTRRDANSNIIKIARPSCLREAKALVVADFCVENLDNKFICEYYDVDELESLSEMSELETEFNEDLDKRSSWAIYNALLDLEWDEKHGYNK